MHRRTHLAVSVLLWHRGCRNVAALICEGRLVGGRGGGGGGLVVLFLLLLQLGRVIQIRPTGPEVGHLILHM